MNAVSGKLIEENKAYLNMNNLQHGWWIYNIIQVNVNEIIYYVTHHSDIFYLGKKSNNHYGIQSKH